MSRWGTCPVQPLSGSDWPLDLGWSFQVVAFFCAPSIGHHQLLFTNIAKRRQTGSMATHTAMKQGKDADVRGSIERSVGILHFVSPKEQAWSGTTRKRYAHAVLLSTLRLASIAMLPRTASTGDGGNAPRTRSALKLLQIHRFPGP